MLVAAGVRIATTAATFPVRLVGDEYYYVMVATNLARGEGHQYNPALRAYRPPGQAWWLALWIDPSQPLVSLADRDFLTHLDELDPTDPDARVADFLRPMLVAMLGLGTGLVLLTFLLGRALFDERVGLVAAAVAALDPTLVAYSHYLWSETTFAVLATGGLLAAVVAQRRQSPALSILSGSVLGLGALTREIALPVAGACALWIVASAPLEQRRAALVRGALLLVASVLVVLPWTLRNYAAFGRVVPVATVGWASAGEGNTLENPEWYRFGGPALQRYKASYFTIEDEMERMDFARRHTLARIRAEQPAWVFKKTVLGIGRLLAPDSFLLRKLRIGSYGQESPPGSRWLAILSALFYVSMLGLGLLGIAACRGPLRLLPLLVLTAVCALHVAAIAHTRYRLPWMPLLLVYAAHAALDWPSVRRALHGWRALPAAAVLVFVATVSIPYAWEGWRQLWTAGP